MNYITERLRDWSDGPNTERLCEEAAAAASGGEMWYAEALAPAVDAAKAFLAIDRARESGGQG